MTDLAPAARQQLPSETTLGTSICPPVVPTLDEDLRTVEAALNSLHGFLLAVGGPAWTYFDETILALRRIEKRLGECHE